jgi:hypothetical protein
MNIIVVLLCVYIVYNILYRETYENTTFNSQNDEELIQKVLDYIKKDKADFPAYIQYLINIRNPYTKLVKGETYFTLKALKSLKQLDKKSIQQYIKP